MPSGGTPAAPPEDLLALLDLEETAPDRFRARTPSGPRGRVFGGVVVAQALMAAIRSIEPASGHGVSRGGPVLRAHSLHGYFLHPVAPAAEAELQVEPLRDSRSFALRQVTTLQQGRPAARFSCSFHVEETGEVDYQLPPPTDLGPPEEHATSNDDGSWDLRIAAPVQLEDGAFLASGRHWVRMTAALPEDPAVHSCLLAYFSDQTRLSFRPWSPEAWGTHTDASLDHALWLHRPARADAWLRYELQALVARGNRATVRGLMYDAEGALVASMAQELLVRPIPGAVPQPPPWRAAPD